MLVVKWIHPEWPDVPLIKEANQFPDMTFREDAEQFQQYIEYECGCVAWVEDIEPEEIAVVENLDDTAH